MNTMSVRGRTDRMYTRYGNPTFTAAEARVAELEGAEDALVFSSRMAAIGTALLGILRAGDHVVVQRDIYGGALKDFDQAPAAVLRGGAS